MFPKILQERRRFLEQLRSSFESCIHLTKCEAKALRRRTLWDMVYLRLNCDFTHLVSPALSDIGSSGILSQHARTLLNRGGGGDHPSSWCDVSWIIYMSNLTSDQTDTALSSAKSLEVRDRGKDTWIIHHIISFSDVLPFSYFSMLTPWTFYRLPMDEFSSIFFLLFTLWHSVPLRTRSRVKKI